MKAAIVNCTLKPSPERSNTGALAEVVGAALRAREVEVGETRAVDHSLPPGVESDLGEGDDWPAIRERILGAEILVFASPTWLGRPSSIAQRVLERMDAMLSEQDEKGRPVAYNHVAGVVVTGNEDGAHHVISEISGALIDIGFTVPGQSWTYWNRGPGPGEDYLDVEEGHRWSHSTGEAAAANLVAVAKALAAHPSHPARLAMPATPARPKRRGRLRRSDCSGEGLHRRRSGRGFSYRDADGHRIDDGAALERIAELAIPPAWKDVWICPDPLGHIQATGIDAAGRKQYLYHSRWQERRAERKFAAMREFARALPRLRRAVTRDLGRQGMPRERALACAVRLLDLGFFRIGGEEYADVNESYGVATVLREHVTVRTNEVVFDFPAKSGQRRVQSIRDPAARRAIEAMQRRRSGPADLLAYREGGAWHDVRSEDVNAYIQEAGEGFSAKDFRTWHGTVLAATELAGATPPASRDAARRAIKAAIERVAETLGNTPAVCRSSYIDPRVLDRFRDGVTVKPRRSGRLSQRARAEIEREVLALVVSR